MSSFDPGITQKVKVEIARTGDTDRRMVLSLHMKLIENVEQGVKDNARKIEDLVSEKDVKNLIAGALTADAQRHKDAIKTYYKRVFWRAIAPLAGAAGTAISAFAHSLISHWHVVLK